MSDPLLMARRAEISDCGAYRYTLSREWDFREESKPMVFVMLNPSTADASVDDPTIRRCIGFARREGCGSLLVVNLFAFRATEPKAMKSAPDPIGAENDFALSTTFLAASLRMAPVVAGWGAHGSFKQRDRVVYEIAKSNGVLLQCLGTTKDGAPKHPLYIAASAPLVEWSPQP